MVEPLVWLPMASGSMCAATAAAEPLEEPGSAAWIVWVSGLARAEERELGGDRLAGDERASRTQASDHARVGAGDPPGVQRRAILGGHARGIEDVLDADGDAVEGADGVTGAPLRVGGAGSGEQLLRSEEAEGTKLGLAFADPAQARRYELFRAESAGAQLRRGFGGGE